MVKTIFFVKMPCTCNGNNWRQWIGCLLVFIYFIFILVSLGVWQLQKLKAGMHIQLWLIAAVFMLLTIPVSFWEIVQHLVHFTQPELQKPIIRILWMVPLYSFCSWLSLKYPKIFIYMDTCKDWYEAFVIYNFMMLLRNYLQIQFPDVMVHLETKGQQQHHPTLCYYSPWPMGEMRYYWYRFGVLQYLVVRSVTTMTTLVCENIGILHEMTFNVYNAWTYLCILNNISQLFALSSLWLFYRMLKEEFRPLKPVFKFLCFKIVICLSFWQAVLISVLLKSGIISKIHVMEGQRPEAVATGLQDVLICIEMLFMAIGNYYIFSYKPYIKEGEEGSCFNSFVAMFDVSDIKHHIAEDMRYFKRITQCSPKKDPVLETQSILNTLVVLSHEHQMKVLQAQRQSYASASIGTLDKNIPHNAAVAFHQGEHTKIDIPEHEGPPDGSERITQCSPKKDPVLETQSILNTLVVLSHEHQMKVLQAQRQSYASASIGTLDKNIPHNAAVAFHQGEHTKIDIPEHEGPPDGSERITQCSPKKDPVLETQSILNTLVVLSHEHQMKVLQAQRQSYASASIGTLDKNIPHNAAVAFHQGEHTKIDIPEHEGPPDGSERITQCSPKKDPVLETQSILNTLVVLSHEHQMKVLQAQRQSYASASIGTLDKNIPHNAAVAFHQGEHTKIDIPEHEGPPDGSGYVKILVSTVKDL
ncbi:transmembrane protein 184C-like isoform X2 [Chionomys nivalis]|uniref:transmembrane protein 184C-like isoform X2 n=1 Tax=Chionomys nivalis TaxID=269649 RepID=UPI002595B34A|nr:transmembrane protein 184C-like isoform X2 [Chionomys nivalis]